MELSLANAALSQLSYSPNMKSLVFFVLLLRGFRRQ